MVIFSENLGFIRFVSFFVCLFQNILFRLFRFYTETESFMLRLNKNKQKTNQNSLIESVFWHFSENLGLFQFVSVCFETVLFVSVVLIYVLNNATNRNKPKSFVFGFTKQTETQLKQILFRFVSVRTEFFFFFFEATLPETFPLPLRLVMSSSGSRGRTKMYAPAVT